MEYREEVGDQLVRMRKIMPRRERVCVQKEGAACLPVRMRPPRLGSQGSFLEGVVGASRNSWERHVRLSGERIGALGRVALVRV